MPRGKKTNKELTIEERLKQALVPAEEQPYSVPENWCWVYLTSGFAECMDSYRKPINATERANRSGKVPYYGATGQVGWIDDYLTNEQLVLVGEDGAPFLDLFKDKAYIIEGEAWVNNHAHILRSFYGEFGNHYLKNYLNIFNFTGYVNGTTRLKLTQGSLDTIPIPLPPLAEQQRIVDRIESLFAKLDEAKEKAQAVVDGFETRRAAILHKAFTGELTEKWRQEHGVSLESWKRIRIQDICEKIVCGKTPKEYINPESEIPYLKVYNIVNNKVDFQSAPQYIPREIHNNKLRSSILKPHDVIMNIVGPPLRKIAIVPEDYPEWNMNQAIVRFRPFDILNYRFLYYTLVNPETLDGVISATKGVVGQANISVSQSRNLPIQLPLQDEQKEIVRILDTLLAKEQQAKEMAEAVLDQIEAMKKSILARAFRGELGTNDPAEESAEGLLQLITQSRG